MPISAISTVTVDAVEYDFNMWRNMSADRVQFNAEDHTLIEKHTLTLDRTLPIRRGNFYGAVQGRARIHKEIPVETAQGTETKSPITFSLSSSIPVGATRADALLELKKLLAFAGSADGQKVLLDGDVTVI